MLQIIEKKKKKKQKKKRAEACEGVRDQSAAPHEWWIWNLWVLS
jgi:hypothetical protein